MLEKKKKKRSFILHVLLVNNIMDTSLLYKKKSCKYGTEPVIVNTYIYHNFLFPRQIYFNVVVADTKALATSATTHIFSSCKLTIPTSIIFLQIYVIFSILSVK